MHAGNAYPQDHSELLSLDAGRSCILWGVPISKSRPKFRRVGKHVTTYDPQASQKKTVSIRLLSLFKSCIQKDVAYRVHFEFFMPLPQSASRREKNRKLWSGVHSEKPDLDNLIKFYLDAANEILWKDDRFIFEVSARKAYSENPRTVITIFEVPMDQKDEVQEILSLFSPVEFKEMMHELQTLYKNVYEDPGVDLGGPKKLLQQQHSAALISRFADRYGDRIKKISSKYTGAWQKLLKTGILEDLCQDS